MCEIRTGARKFWWAGACVGAFAALQGATVASAAIVEVTFAGTVIAGVDTQAQFGGGDLTGDTYVATYDFDGARGELFDRAQGGESLVGGSGHGDTDPLISANVTIYAATGAEVGSMTAQPQSDFENQLSTFTAFSPGELNAETNYFGATQSIVIDNDMISASVPSGLFSPASFDGAAGGFGDSVIEEFSGRTLSEVIYLAPTHATLGPPSVSAAPEPATWALMIAGVGAIGAALRLAPRSVRKRAYAASNGGGGDPALNRMTGASS